MTTQTKVRDIKDILSKLGKVKRINANEYEALCPAHDDKIPSLHIRQNKDRLLLNCKAGCKTEDIVKALGLEMADLFLDHPSPPDRKIVATYPYHDANGKIIFEVVRYEPKGFAQRRPDGEGNYIWNLKGITPVLYKLPEVLKAISEGKVIYVVEGEADVHRLIKEGLVATTNPMGAGKWRAEYCDTLAGGKVVVIPDNDEAGKSHALAVANSLVGKAKSLKLLELQGCADVTEWLDAGGTIEYLQELIGKEPEYGKLSKPTISSLGDIYELLWEYENIKAEVKNIVESSSGISGEIRISDVATNERFVFCRLNFLSDVTKNNLIKRLKDKRPLDWESILETVSDTVIERHRSGNKVKRKADLPAIVSDPYRVYPTILEGLPTIYYGYGGSLKSYLLKLIGLLTHNGISYLGFEPKRGNTLFLDFENDDQTYKRRMTAIQEGLGMGELDFPFYKDCRGKTLPQLLLEIQKQVLENNIKLAIVDSMTMAAGGYEYEQSIAYLKAIATLGIATVTVDHRAKGMDKGSSPIGAVIKSNTARIVFEVTSEQEKGANCAHLTAKNTKNNDNALLPDRGYRVEFSNTGRITTKVRFEEQEPRTLDDIIKDTKEHTRDRIVEHFKKYDNKLSSPTDISSCTGIPANTITQTMKRNLDLFEGDKGDWKIRDAIFSILLLGDKTLDNDSDTE